MLQCKTLQTFKDFPPHQEAAAAGGCGGKASPRLGLEILPGLPAHPPLQLTHLLLLMFKVKTQNIHGIPMLWNHGILKGGKDL